MPPTTTPRRIPGRTVLAVSAAMVITLGGIAGVVMVREKPRAGVYQDVLALEGDFAVGVREETTGGRAFIELIALGEGLRWQALVPGYAVPEGAVGIAAAEHAITVRFPRDGRTQIFGFSALTSKKLGTILIGTDRPREADSQVAAAVATVGGGAQSFEFLEPDGGPTRVSAVSLRLGGVEWAHDLPVRGVTAVWLTGRALIVEQPGAVTALPRDGAAPTTWPAARACALAGEGGPDQILLEDGGQLRLVSIGGGETIAAPLAAGERFTGLCGRRAGRIVAGVDGAEAALLVLAPGSAAVTRRIPLGPGVIAGDALLRQRPAASGAAPLAGALPAIVPVLVTAPGGAAIVGVDVDRETVAWRSAPSAALADSALVAAGARVLVRGGDVLASIDPATGAARAVQAPGTRPLFAHHTAGGAVWLAGARGLTSLDIATLTPRGEWHTGPEVTAGDPSVLGLIAAD